MDSSLSWRPHIDKLCKKLATAVYQLKALSFIVSTDILKLIYFAQFESRIRYGIVCWGNSCDTSRAFRMQKRAVRAMVGVRDRRVSCRPIFEALGILPLPSLFIFEILIFIRGHKANFRLNSDVHGYNTRDKGAFFVKRCRLSKTLNSPSFLGIKLYNKLPKRVTLISCDRKFKQAVKALLHEKRPYSIQEYLDYDM